MNKEIRKHQQEYWYIKKINLLPLLGLILFVFLAIVNFNLINNEQVSFVFNCEGLECQQIDSSYLINLYPIIGEYIFISLSMISLVALIKGGFNKLKRYKDSGLIIGLIGGLISGLIIGLISGLIGGLISGLISGLIVGMIVGLIIGLIVEIN